MTKPTDYLQTTTPPASVEEAAAIAAALEYFMRATAPAARPPASGAPAGWRRTALLEGMTRDPGGDVPDPWINP